MASAVESLADALGELIALQKLDPTEGHAAQHRLGCRAMRTGSYYIGRLIKRTRT